MCSSDLPDVSGDHEKVLNFASPELDNHFGENWSAIEYTSIVNYSEDTIDTLDTLAGNFNVYPNPTLGSVTIQTGSPATEKLEIFSVAGELLFAGYIRNQMIIDLKKFGNHILLIRIGGHVEKIMILKE